MEVREYFMLCEERMPQKCTELRQNLSSINFLLYQLTQRYTELRQNSFAQCQNGVDTMEELCQLWYEEANQLEQLRDIGAKSLALIQEVCASYEEQLTKTTEDFRL